MAHAMTDEGGKDRNGETGRYVERVSDAEILTAVGENELVGSSDVADEFDISHQTAYRRLKALEEEGRVSSRRVGRTLIWAVADSEDEV